MWKMLEAHQGSWFLLVLFFLVSYFLPKQKITLMLQRLFAVIMIISGVGMLFSYGFPLEFIFKGVLAVIVIGVMEMLVGKKKRNEPQAMLWVACIILLAVIILTGYGVIF
ncbi:DUF1516 family protein [Salibacterium salarium]|uniref:DUF1516 family protein n=2 Tax=Salibacterium salarium TaxID=284579 RepID=A0A3R9QNS2_9BACI|nr:DUF1516 family protein [Salibacterium salarium]